MIVSCPVCGKEYDVLYPDKWTYKRRRTGEHMFYLCSWSCLRKFDEAKESVKQVKRKTVTLEQKKKAVDIALAGGNPLTFLAECGSANPVNMWWTIKQNLKEVDPEKYEKLQKRLNTGEKTVPGIPIDRIEAPAMPQKAETPEEPEVTLADAMKGMKDAADQFFGSLTLEKAKKDAKPVKYDDMTIREVEGVFGRCRRSDVNGITYIDFECEDGLDVLSLTVNQWIQFQEEQGKAFAILGGDPLIRIIPDIPRIHAWWCRRTSEIPDFLEVPMSNGETVRYYPQIEQPAFRASLETIRKMNQLVVGYENKNGR